MSAAREKSTSVNNRNNKQRGITVGWPLLHRQYKAKNEHSLNPLDLINHNIWGQLRDASFPYTDILQQCDLAS